MVSGEQAGGKKRKAASAAEDMASAAARREPRRGLGVAELERIRVALEMAERCYAAASSLSSAPQHLPPPALPPHTALVVHAAAAGVAAAPAHHHHQHQHKNLQVGTGAVHQLQMTRGYLTPYCLAQHYYGNDSLTSRLFTTNGGHPSSSHQNHHSSHHHNHYRQADHQIQSAVTALPVMGQDASSESSSSASQRQDHRRAHAKLRHTTTAPPKVAFVDLVDSDDDATGGDVEELDLELKL